MAGPKQPANRETVARLGQGDAGERCFGKATRPCSVRIALPADPGMHAEFRTMHVRVTRIALMKQRRTQLVIGFASRTGLLVGGLVLGDDVARNAAALADLVAALPSPFPDLRTTLPAGASTRLPPSPGGRRPAGVIGKC